MAKLRGVLPWVGSWPTGVSLPGRRVDGEDRDAVVPAVRAVEELARGVDLDLGRVNSCRVKSAGRVEIVWISVEDAVVGVVGERGHRVGDLVDDVGEPPVGVEGEVPRAGRAARPWRRAGRWA